MVNSLYSFGQKLFESGRFSEAYELFSCYADKDVKCSFGMARALHAGYGVAKDESQARAILVDIMLDISYMAIDGEDAEAQAIIEWFRDYVKNNDDTKDEQSKFIDKLKELPKRKLLKLIENNNANAMVVLADRYYEEENYLDASDLYEDAARLGHVEGAVKAGKMYVAGEVLEVDLAEAQGWYELAAKNGDPLGRYYYGVALQDGYSGEVEHDKAFVEFRASAQAGNAQAALRLAECYQCGYGTKVDHKQAYEWYVKSADGGCRDALCALGSMYYQGNDYIAKDRKLALYCYLQAAYLLNSTAMEKLATIYHEGIDVTPSAKITEYWLVQAADHGSLMAEDWLYDWLGIQDGLY